MKQYSMVCALAVLLVMLGSVPAWSQTASAQVEGTVVEAGKPLPNATLTLTNTGTGRGFKIKTDQSGKFSMLGVPFGDYEIEVMSATGEGFLKQKTSVVPSDASAISVLKIEVGQTQQSSQRPTVEGDQTAQGGQGTQQPTYTKEQIEQIKKQNEKAANLNALIQQVNAAITSKNWAGAVSPLEQLIATDPNNWQYYSGLGDAQLNLGKYDQAVETYEKGIQVADSITTVDPRNPSTDPATKKTGTAKMLTNEGNAYLKLHDNKAAVNAYTRAASMDSNPAIAYFNLCATQYNTGNVEGALDACDKAIAADATKADAYFIKGSLLLADGKQDKNGKVTAPPGTAEALNKYLELAPNGAHANDVKQMLDYIGNLAPADDLDTCNREGGDSVIAACTRVIQNPARSTKSRADAYINRGIEYRVMGDPDRAIQDYDQAIRLKPDDAQAFNNRGLAYADKRQYDRAIQDYDQSIRHDPHYAVAFYNRGNAYYSKGQYDPAIQDYDQAIRLKPDYTRAFNNRGIAYKNKGQYDRAVQDYDQAIRLDPKDHDAFYNRGNVYYSKGQYDRAIQDFDLAIRLDPKDPDAYYNRGNTKLKKGDTVGGRADIAKAKQLNPNIGN